MRGLLRSCVFSSITLIIVLFLGIRIPTAAEHEEESLETPVPSATQEESQDFSGSTIGLSDYTIGPEDVLDIAVWKNQDISRTVVVRPDGMISLPLLNDVQAGGLTPRQLRDTLRQKLTEYLSDPEVSVIVNAVHSFKVSVMGAVEKPGRFELGSRTTVLDALALAGGFKESASPDQVIVLRNYGTEVKRLPFDYRRIAFEGGETENFPLQPGDIIVVPEGTPGQ